jgi:hypothetical protein
MKATRYKILRGIEANSRKQILLTEKPIRVATLIDEQNFLDRDGEMVHNQNVFLEDRTHDWDWRDGKFSYYTRIAEVADVLLVYELEAK